MLPANTSQSAGDTRKGEQRAYTILVVRCWADSFYGLFYAPGKTRCH